MNTSNCCHAGRAVLCFALAGVLCTMSCGTKHPAQIADVQRSATPSIQGPDIVLEASDSPLQFVVYGDVRFTKPTSVAEREFSNSFARRAIVRGIAERKPAFVLMSGDLVLRGAYSGDWKYFDQEIRPLQTAHIPIFPTIGNHEYLSSFVPHRIDRQHGLDNYYRRFPQLPQRAAEPWYAIRAGKCYFLMLDSEDDDSSDSPQMRWVQRQLDALPSAIEYTFVVLHRAPYTSASDSHHHARAAERELAQTIERRQRLSPRLQFIVIAGHVHNYERFQNGGVVYIVSGGGGAHPHALRRSADDLYKPLKRYELEYHFCLFTVVRDALTFQMFRLDDGTSGSFTVRDTFSIAAR